MIELFKLVLDLLQIKFSDQHISLAEKIIKDPKNKIISFYDKGFLFFAFQDMIIWKIIQDEFVALGDSFWILYNYQNNPVLARESFVYWLKNEPKYYYNSFIVFSKDDKSYIEKTIISLDTILKKINSQIFWL